MQGNIGVDVGVFGYYPGVDKYSEKNEIKCISNMMSGSCGESVNGIPNHSVSTRRTRCERTNGHVWFSAVHNLRRVTDTFSVNEYVEKNRTDSTLEKKNNNMNSNNK